MSEKKQTELKNKQLTSKTQEVESKDEVKKQVRQPRQRSRQKQNKDKKSEADQKSQKQDEEYEQQSYPEEDEMMNVLGFSSFASSKKKDHTKSAVEGVFKNSSVARKYRQYMNRPGNFNRKLDAM